MPSSLDVMRQCAGAIGAKAVRSLYFGMVSVSEAQKLNRRQYNRAKMVGGYLAGLLQGRGL